MVLWIPLIAFTQISYPKIKISSNGDTIVETSFSQYKLTIKLLLDREKMLKVNIGTLSKIKSYESIISSKDKQLSLQKSSLAAKDTIIKNLNISLTKKTSNETEYKNSYEIANNNLKKQKRRSKLFGSLFGILGGCLAGTITYIAINR